MLKWIALLLMIVDHIAYVIHDFIPFELYIIMRGIGRLSFPVFVYYVVLGLGRTSNLKSYMLRLFAFAVFAEIAKRMFDIFQHSSLNVIFSLFIYGVIYMLIEGRLGKLKINNSFRYAIVAIILLTIIPYVEYNYAGFLIFISLYYINKSSIKNKNLIAMLAILLSFTPEMLLIDGVKIQWIAGFAGLLMFNKTLDSRIFSPKVEKWTFYWFYPIQWILLGLFYYLLLLPSS